MYVLKKKLKPTCTAHYLGKDFPRACKNMHGHNYNYVIEVGAEELNEYDMVIDFSHIKDICDNWLQENWDHTTIFSDFQTKAIHFWEDMGWKYYVFLYSGDNTTAENMAKYLATMFYEMLNEKYNNKIKYVTMHVWETEGSEAQFTVSE